MKIALLLGLFLAACTSDPKVVTPKTETTQDTTNVSVIDTHTKFFRKYDGFYESFRGHATLLSPAALEAVIRKRGDFLQWDSRKLHDELEKGKQESASQTEIFLQFFTPETEYNDLNRYNTIWHVFLEVDGRKFEGKVRKARGKPIEFIAIYPNFDRFSIPYEITFNISTADVVHHAAKLVLASTLGEAEFEYPAE